VSVGYLRQDEYVILNYLREGEFFGEVAALTGSARTANVIVEEESELLVIPARLLRKLARNHAGIRAMFQTVMAERLRMIDLPISGFDQQLLLELRTNQPDMEAEPALA
jgi:CRP-like cAMP-binding protein